MATNIQRRFGITVEINRDIPKKKYVTLQAELVSALTKVNLDPKRVNFYIHHISIHAAPLLPFHRESISAKMEKLNINLTILEEARKQEKMKFLNHQIGFAYQNKIEVQSKSFRMGYTLPGDYCETHGEFDDYVAVLVEDTCPEKLKKLTMSITAYATAGYRPKLRNNKTGTANTKIIFPLSQDIQLTF